jgi:hypothetical protein
MTTRRTAASAVRNPDPPLPPDAGEALALPDKIKFGLQECRLLVLGVDILLGFAYRAFFGETFEKLSPAQHLLLAVSLGCLLASMALMLAPTMYHRIAYEGSDAMPVYAYTNGMLEAALLPFAAAIGLDLYALVGRVLGNAAGLAFGAGFALLALGLWYGLELALRKPKIWMEIMESKRPKPEKASLKQRLEQVMTEARIILPGVQALLGFQLFAFFSSSFERLARPEKLVHVAGLGALGLSMILLMAPAAYHRIVTEGEATEDVLAFSHWALLGAMVPLAFGLAAELYVTLTRISDTSLWPAVAAAASSLVMLGAWFAVPLIARRRRAGR